MQILPFRFPCHNIFTPILLCCGKWGSSLLCVMWKFYTGSLHVKKAVRLLSAKPVYLIEFGKCEVMANKRSRRAQRKALKKERVENGLCTICGKPVDTDGRTCRACREKANRTRNIRIQYYKANGMCPACGRNDIFDGEVLCPECDEKRWEREQRRKDYRREYQRKLREKQRAEGICIVCGKEKAVEGLVVCRTCKDKQRERIRRQPKKNIRQEWGSQCKCVICGSEPLVKGKRLCEKCYAAISNANKRRARKAQEAKGETDISFRIGTIFDMGVPTQSGDDNWNHG